MPLDIVLVHLVLAAVLFQVMNWIGGHATVSARYYQITYFSRHDEAPAFNAAFRVLAPVVFMVIAGAMLYAVKQPRYVTHLFAVVVYQQVLRWAYLLATGRRLLVRWKVQLGIATASVLLALLVHRQIVSSPTRLLPDPSNLANELWLLIIAFMYKVADQSKVAGDANIAARDRYLATKYQGFRSKFGELIQRHVPDRRVEPLVYAVLIYETFNRPAIAQVLERILPLSVGARSYGPMQVQASRPLTDAESVREGAQRLFAKYTDALRASTRSGQDASDVGSLMQRDASSWDRRHAAESAAADYNVRSDYSAEVMSIYDYLIDTYYKDVTGDVAELG